MSDSHIHYLTTYTITPEMRAEQKRQNAEIAEMLREGQAQQDAWKASMDEALRQHAERLAEARAPRG